MNNLFLLQIGRGLINKLIKNIKFLINLILLVPIHLSINTGLDKLKTVGKVLIST